LQIIYALPFILLSVLIFAVCLAVPQLRRFALPALVVPVIFGVCSIIGWVLFVLTASFVLRLNVGPATGIKGVSEGLLFYVLPGVLGAWLAVRLVRTFERYFLKTPAIRNLMIRAVIALISASIGGFVGLGVATNLLPPGSSVASLWIALIASAVAGAVSFTVTTVIHGHYANKNMA
jgi:hypothetical protein